MTAIPAVIAENDTKLVRVFIAIRDLFIGIRMLAQMVKSVKFEK